MSVSRVGGRAPRVRRAAGRIGNGVPAALTFGIAAGLAALATLRLAGGLDTSVRGARTGPAARVDADVD
ncbi:hypothetical protein ABZ471_00700 [Streptomyces sp. NPDC005728]|uniref:hypothetical protein n=1 Tax=Streptomyces sp. NPDC005728 TaxID=3157054 RepID=UPI0033E2C410